LSEDHILYQRIDTMQNIQHGLLRGATRRAALGLAVVAAVIAAMPALASAPMAWTQAPGYYRMMLGAFEVTALLDDNSPWPSALDDLYPALPAADKAAVRARTQLTPNNDASTIGFLINTGGKLVLVDAGGGEFNDGKLVRMLKASGYQPEQVDEVFLTHMHPDHVGGLAQGGARVFPNARVHANARELAQWQRMAGAGDATGKAVIARIAPYLAAKRYESFDGAGELMPGLRAVPSYGHTAGHTFYQLESAGVKLMLWGDFLVNEKLQLDLVDVAPPSEADGAAGIALRRTVYADAAREGYLIADAHAPFPGIGRVREIGGHYVWIAADYASLRAAPASR
jgi:glyoxylase-like metal-dependent hydrolase (beta-lactamase superfamily II)